MRKEDYAKELNQFCAEGGYTEDITEENFVIPAEADYEDFGEDTEEWDIAEAKPGLWETSERKSSGKATITSPPNREILIDQIQNLGRKLKSLKMKISLRVLSIRVEK